MGDINIYYFISPLSGAVIGYFTNWVAIKMLFRPHEEKYVFGKKVPFTPGLIPSRRYILAKKVGETISEYLLTEETLAKSFCSPDVKKSIEKIIDNFLENIRNSDKTIGEALFRGGFQEDSPQTEADGMAKTLYNALSDYLMGEGFLEYARKLDKTLLDFHKPLAELLPEGASDKIKGIIKEKPEALSNRLIKIIESPFVENEVRPVVLNVISQNVKGFASLFVIPEKVYASFIDGVIEYLNDPDNYETTADKLIEIYERLGNANVSALADAVSEDDQLLSALAGKLKEDSGETASLWRDIGESAASKLCQVIFGAKLKRVFGNMPNEYWALAKKEIISLYDNFVMNNMPSLIRAINLPALVEKKINEFGVEEAEDIIISVVDKELKAITYFGGILGFVIGIVPPLLQSLGIQ